MVASDSAGATETVVAVADDSGALPAPAGEGTLSPEGAASPTPAASVAAAIGAASTSGTNAGAAAAVDEDAPATLLSGFTGSENTTQSPRDTLPCSLRRVLVGHR